MGGGENLRRQKARSRVERGGRRSLGNGRFRHQGGAGCGRDRGGRLRESAMCDGSVTGGGGVGRRRRVSRVWSREWQDGVYSRYSQVVFVGGPSKCRVVVECWKVDLGSRGCYVEVDRVHALARSLSQAVDACGFVAGVSQGLVFGESGRRIVGLELCGGVCIRTGRVDGGSASTVGDGFVHDDAA